MNRAAPSVHIPLDELALDTAAQRAVLRRLGIRPSRDGRKTLAELCHTRSLEPVTLLCVLTLIGEPAAEEDVPELMALPELCASWVRQHHGRLESELAALRCHLDFLRESQGLGDAPFFSSVGRFCHSVSRHLKWEQRLWRSTRQTPHSRIPARETMARAATRAHEEHARFDETLAMLLEELAIRSARSDTPPRWYRLRRALEHLQTLLHAQIFREQRWIFPRLVASAPMT